MLRFFQPFDCVVGIVRKFGDFLGDLFLHPRGLWVAVNPDPWADPQSRSSLRFHTLHHRSCGVQNWRGVLLFGSCMKSGKNFCELDNHSSETLLFATDP